MGADINWMHWGGGGIWMLVWWVLIIVGIAGLVRWIIQQTSRNEGGKSALEILKERYVKGEISKEEFEQIKRDIQ